MRTKEDDWKQKTNLEDKIKDKSSALTAETDYKTVIITFTFSCELVSSSEIHHHATAHDSHFSLSEDIRVSQQRTHVIDTYLLTEPLDDFAFFPDNAADFL